MITKNDIRVLTVTIMMLDDDPVVYHELHIGRVVIFRCKDQGHIENVRNQVISEIFGSGEAKP